VKERIAQDLQTKVKKATVKSNPLNQARLLFFANQIYTIHKYYICIYVYIYIIIYNPFMRYSRFSYFQTFVPGEFLKFDEDSLKEASLSFYV
jgi:hypothetical protein